MIMTQGFNYAKKFIVAVMALLLMASSLLFVQPAKAASVDIVNNSNWLDTDGNPIWVQGGFVFQKNGTYYWYGMDYSVSGVKKINLYTSTDLKNWTKHANVVDFTSINAKLNAIGDTTTKQFADTQWVGRPLVMYNSTTSKYVMLAEWSSGDGNRNKITYFTSDTPNGPFMYQKNISQPSGYKMGDLGSIFTDDDGSTYITYTIDYNTTNGGLQISKLSSDFMDIVESTKTFVSTGPFKEATTLFKRGSKYIMMASTTNGWASSQTWCYSATSLSGTWATPYVCATSPYSGNSFDTQIDQILLIQGTAGTMYMYIGDRWNNMTGGSTGVGRIQWYPLTFDSNGAPTINGYAQWSLDAGAGTWAPIAPVDVNKTYTISIRWPGKALGIAGDSTVNYALLEQRTANSSAGQKWKFIDAGGDYYNIRNVNSGLNLSLGGSTASGTQVSQFTPSTSTSQQFSIVPVGSGYFKLVNRGSGKVLGNNGNGADGAIIDQETDTTQWSQNFSFTEVTP
ncbi:RICIN domain-containing protein [Paenibacillus alba]|uniref:RICIN domain-containing protein n=1 Tax=Paenibacillus alba TaxID=1197127 RepID=A0ABU6FYF2_9BACL|nr:RICIN domain-containing protein [Paenibacillus alba]MEC0226424.1 RICIN domain-containing protein [Paenibacillus alba]